MYVIIVGGGGVGERTAKKLEGHGVRVTVIDKDEKVCEHLIQCTRANIIHGDATNPRVLEQAEVEKAHYFIALTGDDHTNLITALLARNYGVRNVIVRIAHPVYVETCRTLGFSNIVNPAEMTAVYIDAMIRGIKLVDLVSIAEKNIDVEEIEVTNEIENEESVNISKTMKDIVYPVLIIRGDKVYLPEPGLKLRKGDKLLMIRKRRKYHIF